MLLFNVSQSMANFSCVRECPHCQHNTYHLVNQSRFLRFIILPIIPLKLRYLFECYQCGQSERTSLIKQPFLELISLPKYVIGLIFSVLLALYGYQQYIENLQLQQSYVDNPKAYDTYLIVADKFTGEAWTLTNLKVAQVIKFNKDTITFQVSNYSYKRNNGITMAMRTSLLVQSGYFSHSHLTLPRKQVHTLYNQGVIYEVLRPKAYSLYGGFVMFPPKPKPLYQGLKLDDNNQQGVNYYKAGLYIQAAKSFTLAAESGSQWGQLNLAQMYRDGQGVAKNNKTALFWYKKSMAQGNKKARHELALLCKESTDCK
ncbi:sel1 repeat family protein [Pseudoalteromonas sp. MMG010]|uniref:tetratricopeptide repeat protein n=1 Tax=Pseudoalteromonas sp. MMG010 TaxID=2822685 RepID=UPI001B3A6C1F|nr:tetratricopeptide repeat protein [Pseudoalteromonas sp. MMG010]MBQ4834116.1 sel1 repeat family protein [Pseudoalteromonas sp. MMG010]